MATAEGSTSPGKFVDIFKNSLNFPTFNNLPNEHDLDEDYWKEDPHDGVYKHAFTWFFLGEITLDASYFPPFLRKRVVARDRAGKEEIPIFFYPERGSLDYAILKKGHTISVLLAEQHHFLDLSTGLRIEDLNVITVFPLKLKELFSLSSTYAERKDTQCWSCGEQPSKGLKKCASCKVAWYCDTKCQKVDWKDRHRKWCKAMPKFLFIANADLSKYDKKYWW